MVGKIKILSNFVNKRQFTFDLISYFFNRYERRFAVSGDARIEKVGIKVFEFLEAPGVADSTALYILYEQNKTVPMYEYDYQIFCLQDETSVLCLGLDPRLLNSLASNIA